MESHVVVIYPHPDDEAFGAAGSIVQFREQGVPVTYLCGTLGEMGRNMGNPNIANRETLPQIRKQELLKACEVMDMEVEMLGYRDKTLEFEDRTEIAKHLKTYLDKLKPSLVMTHYPEYGVHPDHNALGAAAIEAVRMMDEAERPVVWAQAITKDFIDVLGKPDISQDVSAQFETKVKAIYSHASQAQGVLSQFKDDDGGTDEFKKTVKEHFQTESFYVWDFTKK